jgi:recombination protein RecR
MTPTFEKLQKVLKKLPGLGYRSAERIALYLTVENPKILPQLLESLQESLDKIHRCSICGNLCEDEKCDICTHPKRNHAQICVVEQVPDLIAIERSAAYGGSYHVLHGKISPIHEVGPDDLNFASLKGRLESGKVEEIILALSNEIEGEATCHYIQDTIIGDLPIEVSRIGFGLPSGGGIVYADAVTLKSALEGRREYN